MTKIFAPPPPPLDFPVAELEAAGCDDRRRCRVRGSLSADASIMAIRVSWFNDYMGYIKVYHTNDDGGNRVQFGQTIYGNATYDNFGVSMDITSDGNTLTIGSS